MSQNIFNCTCWRHCPSLLRYHLSITRPSNEVSFFFGHWSHRPARGKPFANQSQPRLTTKPLGYLDVFNINAFIYPSATSTEQIIAIWPPSLLEQFFMSSISLERFLVTVTSPHALFEMRRLAGWNIEHGHTNPTNPTLPPNSYQSHITRRRQCGWWCSAVMSLSYHLALVLLHWGYVLQLQA